MPNVFVADYDPRREWERLAPGHKTVEWDGAAFAPVPAVRSVLICHNLSQEQETTVSALARRGVVSIVVSGGGAPDRSLQLDGIYYRATRVAYGYDPQFARCLAAFLQALERTGQPDWAALETPGWPEHVVALYLLALGLKGARTVSEAQAIIGSDPRNDGWRWLIAEARGEAGTIPGAPGELLDSVSDLSAMNANRTAAKLGECLRGIRL